MISTEPTRFAKISTLGSRLPSGAGNAAPVQAKAVEPVPRVAPQGGSGGDETTPRAPIIEGATEPAVEQSAEMLTASDITRRFAWTQGFFRSAIEGMTAAKAGAEASEEKKRSLEASAAYRRRGALGEETDQSSDNQLDLKV